MNSFILRTLFSIAAFSLLTSMTISTEDITQPKTQQEFNDFFAKRSFLFSSTSELELRYKKKFNFFQKLKIDYARRQIKREFKREHLLEQCDTIHLKSGGEITAIVSEVSSTEIKYKRCDNKTGPNYIVKKSDVQMISYANGSIDYFRNEMPSNQVRDRLVNSELAKTDPIAIAAFTLVIAGVVLGFVTGGAAFLLVPVGIVLGFVSKNRINQSNGKLKGAGLAIAAITGGLIFTALVLAAAIIVASAFNF